MEVEDEMMRDSDNIRLNQADPSPAAVGSPNNSSLYGRLIEAQLEDRLGQSRLNDEAVKVKVIFLYYRHILFISSFSI
jgi:hypothetical protein